jgi:hypothetical protein
VAERFADHDAGIGDDAIEAVEAMNEPVDRVRNDFLVAHIAVDNEYAALTRISTADAAVRQVDDANLPSR